MRGGGGKWLALIAVVAAVSLLVYAIAALSPNTSREDWPDRFSSVGERLYFTGRGALGDAMIPRGVHHHRVMMGGGGCVGCHGTDRQGGRLFPAFWRVAPPLTAHALAGDHAHEGHSHDTYTAETLRLAITEGTRPDGGRLNRAMPRWSMGTEDLDALLQFLLEHSDSPSR